MFSFYFRTSRDTYKKITLVATSLISSALNFVRYKSSVTHFRFIILSITLPMIFLPYMTRDQLIMQKDVATSLLDVVTHFTIETTTENMCLKPSDRAINWSPMLLSIFLPLASLQTYWLILRLTCYWNWSAEIISFGTWFWWVEFYKDMSLFSEAIRCWKKLVFSCL